MTPAHGVVSIPPAARVAARRALVVDDEMPIRCVIRRYLERRGWQVDEAEDGDTALCLLGATGRSAGTEYDLIISDLRMQRVGGAELHRWIAAHRPEVIDRFVVTSGDVGDEAAMALIDESGCRFLAKPFELSMLAALVTSTVPSQTTSDDRVA